VNIGGKEKGQGEEWDRRDRGKMGERREGGERKYLLWC
jgi:hypothetical protein